MADECCDTIIGGKVYVSVGSERWECNGDVTLQTENVSREASTSAGGKLQVIERSRPQTAAGDFSNFCKGDPRVLFRKRCKVDVAIVEDSRGLVHFFSEAAIAGDPSLNLQTGVISGIVIATDTYHQEDLPGGQGGGGNLGQ